MDNVFRFDCPFEVKLADSASGEFEGYASAFGGVDSHGDRMLPGAFKHTLGELQTSRRALPMYMQHGPHLGHDPRPVGVWKSVAEDGHGLKVSGQLVGLDTETGRYNHALVRDGAMRGLSIGFNVPPGGATYGKGSGEPRRTLNRVHLREISIVDTPSDPAAAITSVKLASRGDLERLLRDGGLSKTAAVKLAAGGWSALAGDDAPEPQPDLQPAIDRLAARLAAAAGEIKSLNPKG